MNQVTIHAAKTNLSKLIEAPSAGEDVIIARGSKPVVRLMPIKQGAFQIGPRSGQFGVVPVFLEPMDALDLDLWEGGR